MKEKTEQRRWPRQQMNISVSLKYSDTITQTWYVGETHDVSVEGMRIVSSSLEKLPLSSRLEILCFPGGAGPGLYTTEPEPVTMTGSVMWQDLETRSIGVRLDS